MAYTTINKSTDHHGTMTWSGNNSTQTITFAAYNGSAQFQPDWTWINRRNGTTGQNLYDAIRGATKTINSATNAAESTSGSGLTAFNSDGFVLGSDGDVNGSGGTYVGWNWKAGTGQGSSNTDGSINTTYTSVNTTAGFSISTYTGTGANASFGHGLGVKPAMFIIKKLSGTEDWAVYHQSITASYYLNLNQNIAKDSNNRWNGEPTTSLINLQSHDAVNGSGSTYVCYAFAEKTGYSNFGSYTGNGNANGAFVYTGFKPTFLILKKTSASDNWQVRDSVRSPNNTVKLMLKPNDATTEQTADDIDFLSNGFKLRTTAGEANLSNGAFIYMAFGQSIVGTNNIPATAR